MANVLTRDVVRSYLRNNRNARFSTKDAQSFITSLCRRTGRGIPKSKRKGWLNDLCFIAELFKGSKSFTAEDLLKKHSVMFGAGV